MYCVCIILERGELVCVYISVCVGLRVCNLCDCVRGEICMSVYVYMSVCVCIIYVPVSMIVCVYDVCVCVCGICL